MWIQPGDLQTREPCESNFVENSTYSLFQVLNMVDFLMAVLYWASSLIFKDPFSHTFKLISCQFPKAT